MAERRYDQKLNIRTSGIREWRDRRVPYNRYEPTPYVALDRLFRSYKFNDTDSVVDFGCGRGRVSFYIHNRFHIPVTGVEVNDLTLEEALANKVSYRRKAKHIEAPLRFDFGLAEQYEIEAAHNRFYFFNPFSEKIFKKVVGNIMTSLEEEERSVDLILYYPLPGYKHVMKSRTPFQLMNKIQVPERRDKFGKFLIYRYE